MNRFAHHRLALPAGRRRIDPQTLTDVATDLLPTLCRDGLTARLIDPHGSDPLLSLEEDERRVRIDVSELARDMERAQVPATRDGLAAALTSWVDRRPVTDRQARTTGIAALGWADDTCTRVAWRVMVPRGPSLALPWIPSPLASDRDIYQIRAAATGRAFTVPAHLRVEGQVALFTAAPETLSTAVLVDPERMLTEMAREGIGGPTTHMIITPGRPVAAAARHIAARLTAEASEPHECLRWDRIADLGWV